MNNDFRNICDVKISQYIFVFKTQNSDVKNNLGFIFEIPIYDVKIFKGSLTLAMGKCLWFSGKIKVCQLSLSSP